MSGNEWRPIESAPKDGTRVMLADMRSVVTGLWNPQVPGWECDWRVGNYGDRPTHWMPLPDPPPPTGNRCKGEER
jgi:Protein of unknown function (DUF551)